jgi:Ca-activated chloride channel homolog
MIRMIIIGALCIFVSSIKATGWQVVDRSESPYFNVKSSQGASLELLTTSVNIDIVGVIANITVKQQYVNSGNSDVEANYIFPASSRSAVHAMTLSINGRMTKAKIERKKTALKKYKDALNAGKSAVLLEQIKPNMFTFAAGNILPEDKVEIELKYSEYLSSYKGKYDFFFPRIVSPRYDHESYQESGELSDRNKRATSKLDKIGPNEVNIQVSILAETAVFQVNSNWPSEIENSGQQLQLKSVQQDTLTDDFRLSYYLSDQDFSSSMITYQSGEQSYFLITVHPPKRYITTQIRPQDYIFVMDVSGSMQGKPLELSKRLMSQLLAKMRPNDHFNVVQFAGGSDILFEQNSQGSLDNINEAMLFVENPRSGGGTEVLPALERAYGLAGSPDRIYNVVLITDGLVNVEREVFDLVRRNRQKVNTFVFGTGIYGDNKYLFDGIAHTAGTVPFIVELGSADSHIEEFREYLSTPLVSNINVNYNGMHILDQLPELPGDIFSQRPLIITGKYQGEVPSSVEVSGQTNSGPWSIEIPVEKSNSTSTEVIRYLWAREKIRLLDDYQKIEKQSDTAEMITLLGLEHNLLTRYTSFVAIDDLVRTQAYDSGLFTPILVGSRVASGAADDNLVIAPVRIAKRENRLTHLKYWDLKQSKWVGSCEGSRTLEIGDFSEQWKLIKRKIPKQVKDSNLLCFDRDPIALIEGSNRVLSKAVWQLIREILYG